MPNSIARMLHCMKRISHLLGLLREEMDDLYDAMNTKKEEVNNGSDNRILNGKLGGDSSRFVASGTGSEGSE